ncbi:MAG TPA: ATPase, T2SS/T4P/T4SS family [Phycisphaerae bacterium]|nr:ATPase, T2SS/T4P/T4SS family [Phycisphaerae bacterium]
MTGDQTTVDTAVADLEPDAQRPGHATTPEKPSGQGFRMGDYLVERGVLTRAQLEECLALQKSSPGERLGQVLIRKGYAKETDVMACLAAEYHLDFVHVSQLDIPARVRDVLPPDFCRYHKVLVIDADYENNTVTVATSDPANVFMLDEVRRRVDGRVKLAVTTIAELTKAIDDLLGGPEEFRLDDLIRDIADDAVEVLDDDEEETADLARVAGESPVVRLANYLICNAVKEGASDIHIEPGEKKMRVRYRIDGVLFEVMSPPQTMHAALVSRLKIMSNLDISERRLPQDGRIRAIVRNRYVDFRVNILPTTQGEKAVIRILDNRSILIGLDRLGFEPDHLAIFKDQVVRPHGVILVTGPTGSGKTTTLYSALMTMNGAEMNISTTEDPVEYFLSFANQVQINDRIGFTFASALRALLRQDPDVIMVGEIRDEETARICVQAALTGHLVLSTLHTNDAPSSITRLINIGIEPYLISASVNAVLAQRLVRRICDKCKETYDPSDEVKAALLKARIDVDTFYRGVGCEHCRNTGYSGRCGIYEMIELDDGFRDLVATRPSVTALRRYATERGMVGLREDGLRKLRRGITTIEEVLRVTEDAPLASAQGGEA